MNSSEVHGSERQRFSTPANQLVALLCERSTDTRPALTTLDRHGAARTLSFAELHALSARLCGGLQQQGLQPGDRVVLQLDDAQDVLVAFWGCVLAGVVPVPLNAAPFYHRPNPQRERLLAVLQRFGCAAVLASPSHVDAMRTLLTGTASAVSCLVLDVQECLAAKATGRFHQPQGGDAAAMFLTSGSTGAAKGVVQTHAAMLAMADATIQMNGFTADDVTLNWMSLDHAGSLVFLGVMPLALGARQVHVPLDYVLKEPTRWLDLIHTWRASITWAPNFVFSLLLDRAEQLPSQQWDLSCMRFMVNAGEAVVSATARRFITLLQQFGLPATALRPAFGMVETCSGITWSRGFRLDDTSDSDAFVSLGTVIPGAAMKIVDDAGVTVAEGVEGRLLLRGESVFKGYEGEPELNASLLQDGWLSSGDLAFVRDGELYVTGREKDVLIINGNNHYCHEIEAVVARAPQVLSDCVAAVGVRYPGEDTESLVIFYALADDANSGAAGDVDSDCEKPLRAEVSKATGLAPRALVLLPAGDFPRTEIGKIKRGELKRRYVEQLQAVAADAAKVQQSGAGDTGSSAAIGRVRTQHDEAVTAMGAAEAGVDGSTLLHSITAIWQRILKLDYIGLDDTFFELGGSSLLAIQVQHALETLLEREVSMAELFDTPTIRSMVAHFSGTVADAQVATTAVAVNGNATRANGSGDIAVIGIGCRFPGAHGPEQFWQVLRDGVETIRFFGADEAIAAGVPPQRAHDPAQVNAAPVLDDVEGFDLDFWHYARREAELLDPQQRVFLETAWEAFEDAGYVPGAALGRVGVYASAATNTYLQNNVYANSAWVAANGGNLFTVNSLDGFNVMVANDKDYLPTRVSYQLDLTGPSMSIQTACSSTLVAVHAAVRALRSNDCDLALAGGCALMLPQHAGHYYDEGMINSPDGHCRAYDSAAKGTIFGSGSGAVLLKRLEQAQADGDAIYAVIKGSAVVNDGHQKMGFTAPSLSGEYRAIAQALQDADVAADSIGFVEGHGTGTPIGDPIEVQALTRAFRHSTQRSGYCALGSVKTNIGHMGIASGIAGFIKAVLSLHHRTLPGTLHFKAPNPAMDIERTPFRVHGSTQPWAAEPGQLRRAGVNSLGIGGTNAHVILEEAPVPVAGLQQEPVQQEPAQQEPVQQAEGPLSTVSAESAVHILPISANTAAALRDGMRALTGFIERHPALSLADLCFTQQQGRLAMPWRQALVFTQRDELLAQLEAAADDAAAANGSSVHAAVPGRPADIVFMFTGQGSQYAGMARQLHATHSVFRTAFDACAAHFDGLREHGIRNLVLAEPDDAAAQALLQQTQYTQPAIFCVQVALVQLYRACGIRPAYIVGHSIGEVAGVWAAGGLSLGDAARLVEVRSRLMQGVATVGAMAAVKADAGVVQRLLDANGLACEIAACNSPTDTTLTGAADVVAQAVACLQQQGLRTTVLDVSHAFHSQHMESIQAAFAAAIAGLQFRATTIPVLSNVDAKPLDHAAQGARYWTQQLRAPVQFMQALQAVLAAGGRCCVEIGPAAILCSLGRALDSAATIDHHTTDQHTTAAPTRVSPQWLPSLRKGQPDAQVFAAAVAALFVQGHAIDWSVLRTAGGRCTHLPTYAWQRERCWIDPDPQRMASAVADPLRQRPLVLPRLGQQLYSIEYSLPQLPVLLQHRVFGTVVPPAALYVSQLLYAAADMSGPGPVLLGDIDFVAPLLLPPGAVRDVQIVFTRSSGGAAGNTTSIELSSQPATLRLATDGTPDSSAVQVHVTAELLSAPVTVRGATATIIDLAALRQRCTTVVDPALIEAHMQAMQVELGSSFRCFRSLARGDGEALALLQVPADAAARSGQGIAAGLIDCHWQTMLAALPALPDTTVVPARIEQLHCLTQQLPARVWAHARIEQHSAVRISATVRLLDESGHLLLETRGIELRAVAADSFRTALPARLYTRAWSALPSAQLPARSSTVAPLLLTGMEVDVAWLAAALRSSGSADTVGNGDTDSSAEANRSPGVQAADLATLTAADAAVTAGTLVYVDRRLQPDFAAGAALNRLLVALQRSGTKVQQVVVVTLTSDAATPHAVAAQRAALQVQAVAAAHELPDLRICAVETDTSAASLATLQALLGSTLVSGQRYRLRDGVLQSLRAAPVQPAAQAVRFDPAQLQVITGGLGGLGLLTLQWMFRSGARRFLLCARSAPDVAATALLASLREQGAQIDLQRCDVSQLPEVRALADVAARCAPVQTLVHAAGQRHDGLIGSLQDSDFTALMQGKAQAALHLHDAFAALKPQYTLYYSSVAGWLGAAAQTNYAAANAALDGLAARYHATGSTVVSVAWGPWANTGMTAALNDAQLARIAATGYGFLEADTAFDLLGRWLQTPQQAEICILAADTQQLASLPGQATFWSDAAMANVAGTTAAAATAAPAASELPPLVRQVLAADTRNAVALLQDHLVTLVGSLTRRSSAEPLPLDAGFLDLGIDSLAALELRKKLETALALKLKSTLILDYPSIASMAQALVERLRAQHAAAADALRNGVSASGDVAGASGNAAGASSGVAAGGGNAAAPTDTGQPDRAALLRQLANELDFQEQV